MAWEEAGPAVKKAYEELNALMSMMANYKVYRAHLQVRADSNRALCRSTSICLSILAPYVALQHVKKPCLPFVGLNLQDLTFLDDGNPNKLYAIGWPWTLA